MEKIKHPLYGLVDNVRSLWNVGSIFRSADAVGLRKLVLCGMTGRPPRPEIAKTALGAEETVSWEYVADPVKAALHLKTLGVSVVALERVPGAVRLDDFIPPFPLCLVVGHEVDGVSKPVLAISDHVVEIPMYGSKTSLNVAVAFGVAAFECLRRLEGNGRFPPHP